MTALGWNYQSPYSILVQSVALHLDSNNPGVFLTAAHGLCIIPWVNLPYTVHYSGSLQIGSKIATSPENALLPFV